MARSGATVHDHKMHAAENLARNIERTAGAQWWQKLMVKEKVQRRRPGWITEDI